ncbi:Bifunctional pantoate ligase/cytidylate kinase [Streptomyces antimycoticus]
MPGKHGAASAVSETVTVLIGDQPGELARIFADAGRAGVNIEDVRIEHAAGQQSGLIQLMVEPSGGPGLTKALRERDGPSGSSGGAGRRVPPGGPRPSTGVRSRPWEASNLVRGSHGPFQTSAPCTRKVSVTVETAARTAPAAVIVAIDGPAGTGKSSTSKAVAAKLGLGYLDTGAQYRAITWWMVTNGIDVDDAVAVADAAAKPHIVSGIDPAAPTISVDGTDVSGPIRTQEVTSRVSAVSAVPEVRAVITELQRTIAAEAPRGIVVEGRTSAPRSSRAPTSRSS